MSEDLKTKDDYFNIVLFSAISVLLLFILHYCCSYFKNYFGKVMGSEIERDMSYELFNHYQKQSFDFFDENNSGKLTTIMTVDIRNVSRFLHFALENALDFFVRLIGAFFVFFWVNVWFGFIAAVILGLIIFYVCHIVPKIQNATISSHEKLSNLGAAMEEAISGVKTIKSFSNENSECQKFQKINNQYFENQKKIHKINNGLNSSLDSFVMGLIPIFAAISMFFVVNNSISMGDLVAYMLYIDILIGPIFMMIRLIQECQDGMVGYTRLQNVLSINPQIIDSPDATNFEDIKGNIEFKNVSFCYENNPSIFENLNFNIREGEYIALVGASGAGKSTLCNLIPRFYEISSGKILIDGIDVKNIKLDDLRKNIGFVQQDTFLFSGTILENIKFGKLNATEEEVFKAAKSSHIHEFITSFPDGYSTQIGQRGVRLSGGQKQRIAISRVFLKNPPILIFDEATSNLDNESEKYIQKSMEKLAKNRTTVIIAHRLSTIKNAKRILVISEGKIAEEGTHEELIEKNGVYCNFYKLL
jgi:ATP-binding cassette subfamily B protein